MKTLLQTLVITVCCQLLTACTESEFSLPTGDPEAGRASFVLLQCNECHSVDGVQYAGSKQHNINVELGGPTTKVKTYANLVTSIINPTHTLSRGDDSRTFTSEGESTMRAYNDFMTVNELTNIVTFLESKYEIWIPTRPEDY